MKLPSALLHTTILVTVLALGTTAPAQMHDAGSPLLLLPPLDDDAESLGIDDGSTPGASSNDNNERGGRPLEIRASAQRTGRIVAILDGGGRACAAFPAAEQVDCIRDAVATAWRSVPTNGDYTDMRRDLGEAWRKLDVLVKANQDPAVRPQVKRAVVGGVARRTKTPIRAVRSARVATVKREASAVLNELSTSLLRSASSSADQGVHYQRAAQALNSSKVLLRSA